MDPFIIKPEDRQSALNVLGTQVTVLVSRDHSSEQRVTLQSGSEGQGPPPHSHPWDESFFVCAGAVEFTCGEQTTLCRAGSFVHIPAGNVHAFRYGPDGGEMLEITGNRSGAVEMFAALDRELPPGPIDVPKAVQLLADHDVTVHL